jgi:hypothetical protein
MDKEFIPTEKWDHMTDEEQDELMANGIGYENDFFKVDFNS